MYRDDVHRKKTKTKKDRSKVSVKKLLVFSFFLYFMVICK